jgi:hypothetical protein
MYTFPPTIFVIDLFLYSSHKRRKEKTSADRVWGVRKKNAFYVRVRVLPTILRDNIPEKRIEAYRCHRYPERLLGKVYKGRKRGERGSHETKM